jgi:ATP/maltotriose-dependent transcriptional regulator MalT
VARGTGNREIGKQLHISTATVKTHLIHIFDKLGVNDRTSAVTVALEKRILTLD